MVEPSNRLPEREFAKLLVQHQPRLTLYFRTLVFRKSDVDDLTQEVAAKAWEQLGRYDAERPFEPWLMAIARFELMSYLRDHKRSKIVFDDDTVDRLSETLEDMRDRLPELDALERCLARVPSEDRELLRQRFELNKTGSAIAKALELSNATITRRFQRIYGQLLLCVRGVSREGGTR